MIPHSSQPSQGCRCLRVFIALVLLPSGSPVSAFWLGDGNRLLQPPTALSQVANGRPRSLLGLRSTVGTSANGNVANQGTQQQQRRPLVVSQCYWDQQSQVCDADDAVNIMYAIKAKPVSAYLWFLLMTYDRETVCGVHKSANECRADKAHRCVYFDDILNIIGGRSGSKSSSNGSTSGSSSSSSTSSSSTTPSSGGKNPASTSSSSRSSSASDQPVDQEVVSNMPLLTAWVAAQFAAAPAGSLSDAVLRRQLMEQLYAQHAQLTQQLKEQLSPEEQQRLDMLLWPGLQADSGRAPTAAAAAAAAGKVTAGQQVQHEVAAPGSSSSSSSDGDDANSGNPAAAAAAAAAKSAKPGASPKPAKKSAAAAAAGSTQQQNSGSSGSGSSSSAPVPLKKKPQILCTSADLLENYIFTRSAYSNPLQAPLALHCPGSKAFELIKCMRLPNLGACRESPDCVVVPGNTKAGTADLCMSRHVQSLNKAQMKQFTFETTLAEPSAVGSCDGACWMRQALLCNRTTSTDACIALSFCRASPSGLCTPRLYTQDNFGSSVQEYMGECVDVDNQRDCERLTIKLVNKGTYTEWQMPAKAMWKCPVPSIGGLLGTDPGLQESGQAVIAEVGQREERAAGMQAAGAAAAAAANAARLVLARGPAVFRQIYFTEGQEGVPGR